MRENSKTFEHIWKKFWIENFDIMIKIIIKKKKRERSRILVGRSMWSSAITEFDFILSVFIVSRNRSVDNIVSECWMNTNVTDVVMQLNNSQRAQVPPQVAEGHRSKYRHRISTVVRLSVYKFEEICSKEKKDSS